ncbi:hypothetical protein ACWOC1_06045 [Enterococcus quebecensis]|uniref:Lipoprotein n=1 Tax=Enterococcus quebecensis TaxID=903983 RepID=A0A1E5GV24_9ENTE|nr:hypothetical protein [Enterococcus quebecensis]OEG16522.1 hypothetical protein BCR23_06435 [Enterococcus quebecensis]
MMKKLMIVTTFSILLFIFMGCSMSKEENDLSMNSGESFAHISHLLGSIKAIREESLVVNTLTEISSTQTSDNLDIPEGSEIYIFIPFKDIRDDVFKRVKMNEKLKISYSNIAITNGVYTLTIIDGSQITKELK